MNDIALALLDDFAVRPAEKVTDLGRTRSRPRASTRNALDELDAINSMDDIKRASGYMSAAQYRVFSQCESKR